MDAIKGTRAEMFAVMRPDIALHACLHDTMCDLMQTSPQQSSYAIYVEFSALPFTFKVFD